MPQQEQAFRRQWAVLWPFTGYDSFGKATVSNTPIQLDPAKQTGVRFIIKRIESMDKEGNTISFDGQAVVHRKMDDGGILALGKIADYSTLSQTVPVQAGQELYEIKGYNETPDIKGRVSMRTLNLMRFRDFLPQQVN